MKKFDPTLYEATIKDIFQDLSLDSLSYRGKIILTRAYTEIIIRRLLDKKSNKHLELGSKQIKEELDKMGFTEPFFKDSVEKIRVTSNNIYHTQKPRVVTESDWNEILLSLQNLFSYLFYLHFKKFKFGTNNEIMSIFSMLPPSIRQITLKELYKDDRTNTYVIDKLNLANLKAFNYETAKQWIMEEKENLESISTPPVIYNGEVVIPASDWFQICIQKIEKLKNYTPIYKDFNEAKKVFIENGFISGNSDEANEFIELMNFVFMGF